MSADIWQSAVEMATDYEIGLHVSPEDTAKTLRDLAAEIVRLRGEVGAMEKVLGEAYQVVGCLLSDTYQFDTPHGEKILDNLAQHKMVHDDVLPWASVKAIAPAEAKGDDRKLAEEGLWLWERQGDAGDKLYVEAIRRCLNTPQPAAGEAAAPIGYFDPDVLAHLADSNIDPVGVLRRKPNSISTVPIYTTPPAAQVQQEAAAYHRGWADCAMNSGYTTNPAGDALGADRDA